MELGNIEKAKKQWAGVSKARAELASIRKELANNDGAAAAILDGGSVDATAKRVTELKERLALLERSLPQAEAVLEESLQPLRWEVDRVHTAANTKQRAKLKPKISAACDEAVSTIADAIKKLAEQLGPAYARKIRLDFKTFAMDERASVPGDNGNPRDLAKEIIQQLPFYGEGHATAFGGMLQERWNLDNSHPRLDNPAEVIKHAEKLLELEPAHAD